MNSNDGATPANVSPIPGYGGHGNDICYYGVTPDGQVWSYPRKNWRKNSGTWLKPSVKKGYATVALYYWHPLKKKSIRKDMRVNRLVAMTYLKTNSYKRQVNHKDGNKLNNHYTNLEWNSPLDNTRHAIRTGLRKANGQNNGNAKLSNQQVTDMRLMYERREYKVYEIARMFGVHRSHVSGICNGRFRTGGSLANA